jgi:hypothetical protein
MTDDGYAFDITSVVVDPRANRVSVGINAGLVEATDFLATRYGEVAHAWSDIRQPGELLCTTLACGTRGGVRIEHYDLRSACTGGFIVRARASATSAWRRYMMTAGHCINYAGGVGNDYPWLNGNKTIQWGNNVASSLMWTDCGTLKKCSYQDVGMFGLGASVPTIRNTYFLEQDSVASITGWKIRRDQVIGQIVGRQGRVSGLSWGPIHSKPHSVSWSCGYDACVQYDVVRVEMPSSKGDSGAGVFRKRTSLSSDVYEAFGILSSKSNNGVYTHYYDIDSISATHPPGGLWDVEPCVSSTCPLAN